MEITVEKSFLSGRPTVAEIDLNALTFNYREIRRRIPRGVKILAVVKADAYGHGALPVSLKLEKLGVEYLGVATSEEGIELREGGIKIPILVLGGIYQRDVGEILKYHLTPVVFEKESLRVISREAERYKRKVKVHLKVDTGMGRLGVLLDQWPLFLKYLRRFENIEIEGIMSHFSMSEGEEEFTIDQWERFKEVIGVAKDMGIQAQYLHMASSTTIIKFPSFIGNLIRPGIMLYGYYPSSGFQNFKRLKPVMTLKTRIHFLKRVPLGTRISYGGTFTTKRESLIATLPIGYADGYSRLLSNRGEVLVRGRRAPVVGNVCMDFVMVDVTDIPDVSKGDEVVLIGEQGKDGISAEEIANKINSIPYEVLCLIGKRVPRKYK